MLVDQRPPPPRPRPSHHPMAVRARTAVLSFLNPLIDRGEE